MTKRTTIFTLCFLLVVGLGAWAAEDKGPATVKYESKMGAVTFDHAGHTKREKDLCTGCHDGLWPKKKVPLNYAKGMHKVAEAAKASCAGCHVSGGKSFQSKGNCNKCHIKGK